MESKYIPTKEDIEELGFICIKEFSTGEREFQKHFQPSGDFYSLSIDGNDLLLELEVMTSENTATPHVIFEGEILSKEHLIKILT